VIARLQCIKQPAESGWTAIRTTGKHGRLTDRFRFVPLEAEFGGVVQDENWPLFGRHPGLRRREVPGEDEAFIDARVAEEPIRSLGRGPVLARGRERLADPFAQLAKHFAQTRLEPLVRKFTSLQFAFHPDVHVGGLQQAHTSIASRDPRSFHRGI
jgi:hypothetical protein